jgi:hypothetical protein
LTRFKHNQSMEDLDQALNAAREAVTLTPKDQPSRATCLYILGDALRNRFEHTGSDEALDQAKTCFVDSLRQMNAPPLVRVRAATSVGTLHAKNADWGQASEMFEAAMKLLPQVSPKLLARVDQEYMLTMVSGLSTRAATAALQANKPASDALALLEAGRGVIGSFAIDSRTDMSGLEKASPALFQEYTELRQRLFSLNSTMRDPEGPLTLSDMANGGNYHPPAIDWVSIRSETAEKLEKVEAQIRDLPGYEEFRDAPSPNYFKMLACLGPIVCFNVTEVRSDAFMVTEREIKVIPLPKLNISDLESNVSLLVGNAKITSGPDSTIHERNRRLRGILKWLWNVAVHPILKDLNLLSSKKPERLPRIWWVTAGLMGLTPLHAAGQKWGKSTENTASHVVSSYIPTFKALAFARQSSPKSTGWDSQRFLIVTMPETTGKPNLDVMSEAHAIQESIKATGVPEPEVLNTPSKDDVLMKLPHSTIVHFACHGKSDTMDPSNSGLLLADGPNNSPDILTVRDLDATTLDGAHLAFLSACSTAENHSVELLDEVIHLSSAFLLVGFPHVIGTMWKANDEAANHLCRSFYRELARKHELHGEDEHSASAYALHDALNALRKGTDRGWTEKGASEDVIGWAPFIHLGC